VSPDAPKLSPQDVSAARETAERFLKAIVQANESAAMALLIIVEGESVDFKSMTESTSSFELGEAVAEGEQVIVTANVSGPGSAVAMSLPLVLRRVGGAWKVDMAASMTRMMGGLDLQKTMETLVQGVGEAMAEGMKAMGEGLAEGLAAMSSASAGDGGKVPEAASETPQGPDAPPAAKAPKTKKPAARKPRKSGGRKKT